MSVCVLASVSKYKASSPPRDSSVTFSALPLLLFASKKLGGSEEPINHTENKLFSFSVLNCAVYHPT